MEWRHIGEGVGSSFSLSAVGRKTGRCVWKSKGRYSSGQRAHLRKNMRAVRVILDLRGSGRGEGKALLLGTCKTEFTKEICLRDSLCCCKVGSLDAVCSG